MRLAHNAPMSTDPDRSLKLAGASNFRDLGGYTGADARPVRWRRLFRSDHLAALTPQDAEVFTSLGVTRVFDFRGRDERAAVPYELPGVAQHPLPIEPTVVQRMKDLLDAGQAVTPAHTVELMQETYRAFVHDNAARFAALFQHLLDSDAPLVFHCTAGKDRTGFAAALILRALGVPHEVILRDYLLTNELYRRPPGVAGPAPEAVLQVLWRVQQEFLDAALHAVDADYGGLQAYLRTQMGLTHTAQARLEALYLAHP